MCNNKCHNATFCTWLHFRGGGTRGESPAQSQEYIKYIGHKVHCVFIMYNDYLGSSLTNH